VRKFKKVLQLWPEFKLEVCQMAKAKINPQWLHIAVREGQTTTDVSPKMVTMMLVACDKCDAVYTIKHDRLVQDPKLAEKQARDFSRKLACHHEIGEDHTDVYWIP
jgi:protein-tyrosine-phosphatase